MRRLRSWHWAPHMPGTTAQRCLSVMRSGPLTGPLPCVCLQLTSSSSGAGFRYWATFTGEDVTAHSGESLFRQGSNKGYGYTAQAGYFVPLPYVSKHLEVERLAAVCGYV